MILHSDIMILTASRNNFLSCHAPTFKFGGARCSRDTKPNMQSNDFAQKLSLLNESRLGRL